jgi:hypothetical protein
LRHGSKSPIKRDVTDRDFVHQRFKTLAFALAHCATT